jgi:glycosyltransferase involved in cell wall biosynthesis
VRILHVTHGYHPAIGGTERLMRRLSEQLVAQFGDEVTVFTTDCFSTEGFSRPDLPRVPLAQETIGGVRVRRFPVRARLSRLLKMPQHLAYRMRLPGNQYLRLWHQGPLARGLHDAIVHEAADVVAASAFPLHHMFTALAACRRSAKPCVFYGGLHPQDDWGSGRPMIYRAIRGADGYVAYSRFEADYVEGRGARPERVNVIPLAVDVAPFAECGRETARRFVGLPEDTPLVGFIGQLAYHKGVQTLLRAMPHVWREVPEAHLLIAGARAGFAQTIDRTLAGWPRESRAKVHLHYDFEEADKPLLFRAIDVFAYPSGFESFGIALLEAWAAEKPVVSCRRGAIPCLVDAGRDGLLVDFDHDELLAGALVTLLRNPAWARTLGATGHAKVQRELTWDKIAPRFRAALEAARASRPHA